MTSNLGTATPGVTFTLLCESGSLRVLADSAHSSPPRGGSAGGHLSGSACSFRGGRSSGGHADLGLCALSHTLLTGRLPVGRDSVALAPGCPHAWKYPTQAQHSEQTCEPASLHGDTPEPRGTDCCSGPRAEPLASTKTQTAFDCHDPPATQC